MKRTRLHDLGETEMEVLQHVWELSRASVGDVHERILVSRKVAYNTVMTVMKNLAEKGYLSSNAKAINMSIPPPGRRTR
jgi:predicted transcriptional regulator